MVKQKVKTIYVPVRMEPELKALLDTAAEYEGITVSEVIRRLIASIPVIGKIKDGQIVLDDRALELLREARKENKIREEED